MAIEKRPSARVVNYPISDGKPIAETDFHFSLIVYIIAALKGHFEGQSVYVSGNNFLYWEEGNPKARVSPDAYVVFGATAELRDYYKTWEVGGKLPSVVFEFTSRKTRREDLGRKRYLYEEVLKVPEYFLFDPRAHYLQPMLQGFRLAENGYVPLEPVQGRLHSERLGLDLVQDDWKLRLWDQRRCEWLLYLEEKWEQIDRRRRCPSEVRRLTEDARHRADEYHRQAEEMRRQTIDAQVRAHSATAARMMLEEELMRLQADIAALRSRGGGE